MAAKSKSTETETKTGTADAAQTGETSPAMRTAGTTADVAGDNTLAADAIGRIWTVDPEGRFTIVVRGPAQGRWRIGRKFTAEPVSIPVNELTEAQLMALRDDPALMVTVIDAPY